MGAQGAYLLVRPASRVLTVRGSGAGGPGLAGGGGPGSFPGTTAVVYRDGQTCPSADPGPDTCVLRSFATDPVHLHLHLHPVRVRVSVRRSGPQLPGTFDATVRFRAPVTVASGALDYSFTAVNPGAANTTAGSLDRGVREGQNVSWSVSIPACARQAKLTISLDGATATSTPWRLNAPALATIATLPIHLPAVRRVPRC